MRGAYHLLGGDVEGVIADEEDTERIFGDGEVAAEAEEFTAGIIGGFELSEEVTTAAKLDKAGGTRVIDEDGGAGATAGDFNGVGGDERGAETVGG